MDYGKTNRIIYTADNLAVLRGLPAGIADLIYLDPPFNSKKAWANPIVAKGKKALASFKDTWFSSDINDDDELSLLRYGYGAVLSLIDALAEVNGDAWRNYLIYMGVRLAECRRVLKETGSIYLHCDPTMNAGLKLLMDAIFGTAQFRNDIVWKRYRGKKQGTKKYGVVTDNLLFYVKTAEAVFHPPFTELDTAYLRRVYKFDDKDGKGPYRFGGRIRDRKYYLKKSKGVPVQSLWDDIPELNGTAEESTGYPTQKPWALLRRIIAASSEPGDLVIDPFCGCASTCVAAEQLGRRWIGIDIGVAASTLVVDGLRRKSAQGKFAEWNPAASPVTHIDTNKGGKLPRQAQKFDKRAVRARLHKQQGGICVGCDSAVDLRFMDIDHITPKARGGRD